MSGWTRVTSGVPQGSVLAPVMFLIYINDMVEGVNSYTNLFADDAKIMRKIVVEDDCKRLQEDIDRVFKWSQEWEMVFNPKICKVLEMGKGIKRPSWNYTIGGESLSKPEEEKDLGIIIQRNLSPEKHVSKITRET